MAYYLSQLKLRTRWFKYDRDYLCVNKSQFVPVIFEPPCTLMCEKYGVRGKSLLQYVQYTCLLTEDSSSIYLRYCHYC
jgi:hypothetical protein